MRTFVGIFGHGSTDVAEVLRIYEQEGVVKTVNVRNETEASHVASMLRWKYDTPTAVFTSIGPGAMLAVAGSLVPLSNGLGIMKWKVISCTFTAPMQLVIFRS